MVSKVFEGHSFYQACRYVCLKSGASVLEVEGVRAHDYKLMAADFLLQARQKSSKKQACFHGILSFYPGEKLSNELMASIAREYLEELGISDTQFAIIKHTDRAHLHMHIIANMVSNSGASIHDSWIGLRGKKTAQKLTSKYNLVPADKKKLELTHLETLSRSEANRYKIYQAITDNLPKCATLAQLARRLQDAGIATQLKYKGQTTELQGISFKIGNDCFKGSKVDRKFSLTCLQKLLGQQLIFTPQQGKTRSKGQRISTSVQRFNPVPTLSKAIDQLTKPEQTEAELTYGQLHRKRRKGLGL